MLRFLSLECPPLLPAAREAVRGKEVQKSLLAALDRVTALPKGEADAEIYPGLSAEQAATKYRESLEEVVRGFFRRVEIRRSFSPEQKRKLFRWMAVTRALDDRLKELFDKKDVVWERFQSPMKGFRSWGQEAIVGVALPLRPGEDIVGPVIRDIGVLVALTGDLDNPLLAQAGKRGTPFEGRDLHIGDLEKGVLPPTAPLAISTQTLVGIAYSFKLDRSDRVCVSFIGEGGSSLGEWHEAINFAGAQRLNMVFVLENNQWALGTHVSEQSATKRFALRGPGYGMPGITVYGNDPEEIAAATIWATERARAGKGPTLLEIVSYRRGGHAHHDDPRFHGMQHRKGYEIDEERDRWAAADPIESYRGRLGSESEATAIENEAKRLVDEATERMRRAPWPTPEVCEGVFAPRVEPAPKGTPKETRPAGYDEAVRLAMVEMMESDPRVFVLGEDIGGRYDGAFGVTRGLTKQFGPERCLNTPLAESAIVGCAVGAALMGKRPIVEIQFADFLAPAFNALVNNAAKIYWRYRKPLPMVVRLPYGGATKRSQVLLGGGPFHSQCPEAWFVRTPGWKIVAPSTPTDAKGLMTAAIRDGNPVLFLESKGLYSFFSRDLKEDVPIGPEFEVPIGRALVRREGRHITCATYGAMVHASLDAAESLAPQGIELEVVDLRTLVPLDEETLLASVRKTSRLMIVHEDSKRGGFGAELAALVAEKEIWNLDAPIVRVAAPDHPVPYSPPLEYSFLPRAEHIAEAARRLIAL